MMEQLTFAQQNRQRIHAVEHLFGPLSKPLSREDRVLIAEGRLMKQSRRGPRPKAFFLFNDMLVYGGIILHSRWLKKQKIFPLEDIQMEDIEDGLTMKNQWLIRTPRKSFYIGAESKEEKEAWMEHIEDYQKKLLQSSTHKPKSTFAVTWIPDDASAICMRCSDRFTMTQRRHHCRKCGFVVCRACSKKRGVIRHIHPTKRLRVCDQCHPSLLKAEAEKSQEGFYRIGKAGSEEDEMYEYSEEDPEKDLFEELDTREDVIEPWTPYVFIRPEHLRPY